MNTYKCRMVVPKVLPWREVQANSTEDAANIYHDEISNLTDTSRNGIGFFHEYQPHLFQMLYFAQVEVEGEPKPFFSKIIHKAIWRRGRVGRSATERLNEVVKALKWDRDPKELLEDWNEA